MKNKRTLNSCAPPDRTGTPPGLLRRLRISVPLAMMLMLNVGSAQDFIVNGTVNNTGTIRVKKQTTIVQGTVGGEIELKGADQSLQAKQYGSVRLSGTGTKTTIGGSFSITKNLTIASPVTLNITKGTIITVGDTLFESGILKGAVQKTVDLSGGTTASSFGNIGATVEWSSSAPGNTTIMRVSDSTRFGNGNQSIRRYYDVQLTDATKTGTVTFKYADSELNGHDVKQLQLWRSTDNGVNWIRQIPVVDTLLKTLTKTNVRLKGLWTAADTVRALGPLRGGAGIPEFMTQASTPDTLPVILTTLDTFKVQITDILGTPVKGVPVSFALTVKPSPSAGGILSRTVDSTDESGFASTVFTLGSKVGRYEVIAASEALNDTVHLNATAQNGAPVTLAAVPVSEQRNIILTPLDTLFTVEVLDIGGNAVDSARVKFVIDSIPSSFAKDQDLSVDSMRTDAFGRASTRLTLGSKVGTYGVKAFVAGVNDSVRFFAKATNGAAVTMNRSSGSGQVGIVGTAVDPFIVSLLDIGDNPVPNEPVNFTVSSFPAGSDTGRLNNTVVPTDSFGQAASILTLGKKVGDYIVSAQNTATGGTLAFAVKAEPGAPKTVSAFSGNNQIQPILTTLSNDFVAAVTDTFGNAVDSVWVQYSIDSLTANGAGARLSSDSVRTDLGGVAPVRLTLGSKSGPYRVNAAVRNVPVFSFTSTASAGAAVAMLPTGGLNQTDSIFTDLSQLFTLRITDIGGNGVPNKQVLFAITGRPSGDTSAAISTTAENTDSSGFVSARLTLGSKVGKYIVRATAVVPALMPESFDITKKSMRTSTASAVIETSFIATAKQGSAVSMQRIFGDRQINPTETELDTAFVVALRDRGDNPVVGDTVRFVVASAPAGASQQAVTDSLVATDSTGRAKTFLKLGTREGLYTVTASVRNVPVVSFTANAYFIYGDINKDIDINVADITSLVDILNKQIIPSASDSLKADFNRDGLIDTLDIGTIRNSILDRSIFSGSVQPSAFLDEANNSDYIAPVVKLLRKSSASAKTVLEATPYGLRVNLSNDEPVRGIELRLHLKDSTVFVNKVNMLFKRAEMMDIFVSTKNREVRVVAYNLSNKEILSDSGSIFRLPLITNLNMIDTTEVTIALRSNAAAAVNTQTATAPPNAYPSTFRLSQNYPNPFNGSTTIEYDIPDGTELTRTVIQVFNILGQRVKTLVSEEHQPGRYTVQWDGTDQNGTNVSTGVYFYRLISKSHVGSRKMLYVK